ncbi:MAG: twin-arginine translocase TatA/TatE family subunit [Bacteroidales bacterium]
MNIMILLGFFGGWEIAIIVLALLILFGGKKIPELMRGLGKGIREFKDATEENPVSKEAKDVKKEIDQVADDIVNSQEKREK